MIDSTDAKNCIAYMRERGTYHGYRIGIVKRELRGLVGAISGFPEYCGGEVVLFREEMTPSDSQIHMGEYMGCEQRPTGIVTIERPVNAAELGSRRIAGLLLVTFCTMVGVPRDCIEEIAA